MITIGDMSFPFVFREYKALVENDYIVNPCSACDIEVFCPENGILVHRKKNNFVFFNDIVNKGKNKITLYNLNKTKLVLKKAEDFGIVQTITGTVEVDPDNSMESSIRLVENPEVRDLLLKYLCEKSPDGVYSKVKHIVSIQPGSKPIYKKNYRLDINKAEFVSKTVNEYLKKGIIEKSTSPWNFPIVVAYNGKKLRMCIDFRALNKITIKEISPPPTIIECLDMLSNSLVFSKIDLKDGYFHVMMDEESKKLTAFTSPVGKFQFVRMPFGLTSAPSTFQLIMYDVLREYIGIFVMVYMDDIIIFSKDINEHKNHLKQILVTLAKNNLTINIKKCQWMTTEINFLGYIIKDQQYFPDPENFGKFEEKLNVRNIKDLQRIVGFLSYYRQFVNKFAEKTKKIYDMINGNEKFDKEVSVLIKGLIKEILSSDATAMPDLKEMFILEVDASDFALGAVLKQIKGGQEKIIRFASRLLKGAENNYSTTEKELLAIVFGIKKFEVNLCQKFLVKTDHKPLIWLKNIKNPKGRLARWIMYLSNFEFDVNYLEGSKNVTADLLSRLNATEFIEEDLTEEEKKP